MANTHNKGQKLAKFHAKPDDRTEATLRAREIECPTIKDNGLSRDEIIQNALTVREETKPAEKKTGRGGKHNFPNAQKLDDNLANRQLVSQLLSEVLEEYHKEKVLNDGELIERIDDYFRRCAISGRTPVIEELALSTGYTSTTFNEWERGDNKGFSPQTASIIKKAKEILKSFDAKLVISGKMNFLAYCFRSKNYYGMQDKTEYVVTPNHQQLEEYSESEIRQRYLEGE